MSDRSTILEPLKIRQKLERMAYEIYEEHCDETTLYLVGVNNKGYLLAQQLLDILTSISPLQINLLHVVLDPSAPTEKPIQADLGDWINDKPVVIVDDVANTGRTLLFAMKPFLEYLPKSIQIAVLVDREHKQYPVATDFVGLSLSTTLQEHINVVVEDQDIRAVYLD